MLGFPIPAPIQRASLSRARDQEIESGQVEPLSHEEFLKRTRGASE